MKKPTANIERFKDAVEILRKRNAHGMSTIEHNPLYSLHTRDGDGELHLDDMLAVVKQLDAQEALVERAVSATIEACATACAHVAVLEGKHIVTAADDCLEAVQTLDPAPIVARVLGGGS